jgi:hypothetical protein
MDTIRTQSKNPLVAGIAAAVLGLIVGMLIGWVIWPVQWTDAAPEHLHEGYQEEYLRMAIDSYAVNQDPLIANERYSSLGEGGPQALANIQTNPGMQSQASIDAFAVVVGAGAETPVAAGEVAEESGGTSIFVIIGVLCVLTLVLGGILVAFFILQGRKTGAGGKAPVAEVEMGKPQAEMTDYTALGETPPMVQFMASYKLGDDLFDDSFSIDSQSGEFLGECGVGISETIGVGEPKKVTAFEVWLFDKNDIQTVTKVLMSAHAFEDASIRQRLEAKGEPVLSEAGVQTILDTATLRLVARIVDLSYGEGALPENSFFDSLILELAVWTK